ncbi:hypothetical protein D9M71_502630 [compost metagenome]
MKVFGGFVHHYIQSRVTGHDTHKLPAWVEHRQGQQVVLADQPGHLLLRSIGVHAQHRLNHQPFDRAVRGSQDQLAQRERAEQVALFVEDVGLVDGFGIGRFAAQHVDGLGSREPADNAGVFAAHQRPGAALRVETGLQQAVPTRLSLLARLRQRVYIVNAVHIFLQAPSREPGSFALASGSAQ